MKNLILLCTSLFAFTLNIHASDFFDKAELFFNKYVTDAGTQYKKILENRDDLNELISLIENFDISTDTSWNYEKAFWINTYNILTIKNVLDNYPVESPLKVDGFFNKIKFKAAGEELTLDEIEKVKLLGREKDARIHFAVNCAAVGCPELHKRAFMPETLDGMLNTRTAVITKNFKHVKPVPQEKKLYLNKIFEWYKEDFGGTAEGTIKFLNKHRKTKIPLNFEIIYTEYDWNLNSAE